MEHASRHTSLSSLLPLGSSSVKAISDFVFASASDAFVDYLVVLGAPHIELMEEAARAYNAGLVGKLIVSGKWSKKHRRVLVEKLPADYRGDFRTEAEMMKCVLERLGVPGGDIAKEEESTNIRENMERSISMIGHIEEASGRSFEGTRIGICARRFVQEGRS